MPRVEVRDLGLGDIPRILELEADLFGPEAWTAGMYRDELTGPLRAYRGIDDAGVLVAYGGILVADEAQVLTIGVARSHQRRGLGGLLLRDLLAIAWRSTSEVFLEVRASDDVARHLYERHGFAVVGRRRHYYPRIGEDALVMRAELAQPGERGAHGNTCGSGTKGPGT